VLALDLSSVFDLEYTAQDAERGRGAAAQARRVDVADRPDSGVLDVVRRSPLGQRLGREGCTSI
jgi:hypothetical protein